jgi:[acyl-carrier-protein] S-malonyltransferase
LATSILFPAFVGEYSGTEKLILSAFENNFIQYLARASEIINIDLIGFDFLENNFLDDELKSQCVSYVFSCTLADILHYQKVKPSFVSGYSMGIYAALYYCKSVSFEQGLMMLKSAWDIISSVTTDGKYGMGMVIGLTESDLLKFIYAESDVEICNQNNPHTFIISGKLAAVENVLEASKNEGAMRASLLPVSKPYHSQFLNKSTLEFAKIINQLTFLDPAYKYISALDQQIIDTTDGLKKEVISNLPSRMNWFATMNYLLKLKTNYFFECGAGDGLTRNTRFIDGEFKAYSISRIDRFIVSVD